MHSVEIKRFKINYIICGMWSVNANGFGIFLINAHVSNSFNDIKKHLIVRYKLLFIWHYLKDNVDIYAYQ